MERKMYQFSESKIKQFKKQGKRTWDEVELEIEVIRSGAKDESLKQWWASTHHGSTKGWGMRKAQLVEDLMRGTIEYQQGIWQGRVDAANGLEYSEERLEKAYNLGYYQGYVGYESNRRGWDAQTRARFDEQWVN